MRTTKLLLNIAIVSCFFTSCYTEVIVDDFVEPEISLNRVLSSYDLWYVDVNSTIGHGEIPFLQKAFTISFRNGIVSANNNIVGLGENGNGYGIEIGEYNANRMILDVNHVLDGFNTFDVFQIDYNTIELYNPDSDTSYFLDGYQRNNFNYDFVFYDNIHYFLQEYEAWEKTYSSDFGELNAFDNENYLQFLAGGNDSEFRSSKDNTGINNINSLLWDFTGVYSVGNISGNDFLKSLTLYYDSPDNEYFELRVINDAKIELFQPSSQTVYEFDGRGNIQFLKTEETKAGKVNNIKGDKKRKFKKIKVDNPRENTRL